MNADIKSGLTYPSNCKLFTINLLQHILQQQSTISDQQKCLFRENKINKNNKIIKTNYEYNIIVSRTQLQQR